MLLLCQLGYDQSFVPQKDAFDWPPSSFSSSDGVSKSVRKQEHG